NVEDVEREREEHDLGSRYRCGVAHPVDARSRKPVILQAATELRCGARGAVLRPGSDQHRMSGGSEANGETAAQLPRTADERERRHRAHPRKIITAARAS